MPKQATQQKTGESDKFLKAYLGVTEAQLVEVYGDKADEIISMAKDTNHQANIYGVLGAFAAVAGVGMMMADQTALSSIFYAATAGCSAKAGYNVIQNLSFGRITKLALKND